MGWCGRCGCGFRVGIAGFEAWGWGRAVRWGWAYEERCVVAGVGWCGKMGGKEGR